MKQKAKEDIYKRIKPLMNRGYDVEDAVYIAMKSSNKRMSEDDVDEIMDFVDDMMRKEKEKAHEISYKEVAAYECISDD